MNEGEARVRRGLPGWLLVSGRALVIWQGRQLCASAGQSEAAVVDAQSSGQAPDIVGNDACFWFNSSFNEVTKPVTISPYPLVQFVPTPETSETMKVGVHS
jgi:hypothetical protein